ncbi:MAG: PD-(D/E)XK nuclease family protein, partial [Actinobacteria bacterium]|nr:PD-(D/E)XK nuclease family protein [Actinomycetota bacterium]
SRTSLPLADLVLDVERALLLDVEVAARPGVRPGAARAPLDAFADVAAAFADTGGAPGAGGGARAGSGGSLGAFLGWLAAADTRERGLEAPVTEVRDDAVQVLTVHASKGLEWDVVAVTGLVEGTVPSGTNGRPPGPANGWLGDIGALPYPLRGDRAGLPHWAVEGSSTQVDLAAALDDFREACGEHDVAEERRLAYVAVTRARRLLLMTGAQWGDGSRPRTPSRFLVETADLVGVGGVELLHWADAAEDGTANPRDALVARADWPFDPLGPRRAAVDDGAGRVLAALAERHAAPPVAPVGDRVGWAREVDLLLGERDASTRRDLAVALPRHLSASKVVALATDPVAFAARLRRPMPEPPNPHARRGSAFHAWLEERYGMAALVDVDDLPGAADESAGDEDLAALQAAFLASEWAERVPDAVEVSIETPVAGVVLRGRVDAVFRLPGDRWEVVDWKTGPPPGRDDDAGARTRAVQLAVYRLAWARLQGVPVEQVGAAFFYASAGRTVRPVDLLDAAGLERLVVAATDGV